MKIKEALTVLLLFFIFFFFIFVYLFCSLASLTTSACSFSGKKTTNFCVFFFSLAFGVQIKALHKNVLFPSVSSKSEPICLFAFFEFSFHFCLTLFSITFKQNREKKMEKRDNLSSFFFRIEFIFLFLFVSIYLSQLKPHFLFRQCKNLDSME